MTRSLLLVAALAACGGSSPPPQPAAHSSTPPPVATCRDYQNAAINSLTSALKTHQACQTDADCSTIAFGASCIDACSRAIATSDKDAFVAAVEDINHTQCRAYTDAGCPTPDVPPCAPPSTPHCSANRCE
ncbi:hypothetical protein BH11MYX2_BH11MYX2_31720 [soil metagenome]